MHFSWNPMASEGSAVNKRLDLEHEGLANYITKQRLRKRCPHVPMHRHSWLKFANLHKLKPIQHVVHESARNPCLTDEEGVQRLHAPEESHQKIGNLQTQTQALSRSAQKYNCLNYTGNVTAKHYSLLLKSIAPRSLIFHDLFTPGSQRSYHQVATKGGPWRCSHSFPLIVSCNHLLCELWSSTCIIFINKYIYHDITNFNTHIEENYDGKSPPTLNEQ